MEAAAGPGGDEEPACASAPAWSTEQGLALAHALLGSCCSAGLRALCVEERLPPAAAEALLGGLAALREASLSVGGCQQPPSEDKSGGSSRALAWPWRLDADVRGLESLTLRCNQSVLLDMASLAGAGRLTELVLVDCRKPLNWAAAGALTSLRSLALRQSASAIAPSVRRLACLAPLQQLESLELVGGSCSAADWPHLAALPKLTFLKLHRLVVSEQQQAQQAQQQQQRARQLPSAIESLHITDCLAFQVEPGRAPGCLARQLPALQELVAQVECLDQLACALQGHPTLDLLLVTAYQDEQPPERAWPRQLLRQLPALQDVTLYDSRLEPGALLADLAGCAALQSLHIEAPEEQQPAALAAPGPLAALAVGEAARSLRRLHLGSSACVFEPREVAALLCGSMPLLEEVQLAVAVPEVFGTPALVAAQLPWLLAQAGARVGVRCTKCEELERAEPAGLAAFVTLQLLGP